MDDGLSGKGKFAEVIIEVKDSKLEQNEEAVAKVDAMSQYDKDRNDEPAPQNGSTSKISSAAGASVPELETGAIHSTAAESLAPPPSTKRGRGRPRKQPKAEAMVLIEQPSEKDVPEPEPGPVISGETKHEREALGELDANTQVLVDDAKSASDDLPQHPSTPQKLPPSTPPELPKTFKESTRKPCENAKPTLPETPKKAEKAASTSPKRQSMNRTGPAYRVGLSKRTRIAPLLRVVKK